MSSLLQDEFEEEEVAFLLPLINLNNEVVNVPFRHATSLLTSSSFQSKAFFDFFVLVPAFSCKYFTRATM